MTSCGCAPSTSLTQFATTPLSATWTTPSASATLRGSPPRSATSANTRLAACWLSVLLRHELLGEDERRQVGVWEVAVVVAFFFAALRTHAARLRVVQQRLLRDRAAAFEQRDLAVALDRQRHLDVGERIDVLHLGLGAERRRAGAPHGDVRVHAQASLLHVTVGDPS